MRARYNEVRKQLIDEYYAGDEGERRTPPSYAVIDDRARAIVHNELTDMIRKAQSVDDVKKILLFLTEEI